MYKKSVVAYFKRLPRKHLKGLRKTTHPSRDSFVVTHVFGPTEIPTLLDSPDKNELFVKILCLQKDNCFSSYCPKNVTYLRVRLLWICEALYFLFKKFVSVGYDNLLFSKWFGIQAEIKTLTCFLMCECVHVWVFW